MNKLTSQQNKLIEQYAHVISIYARKWHRKYKAFTYEEIEDACCTALIKSARTFDATKGDFMALYTVAARGQVYKVIRYHNADMRRGEKPLSLDYRYAIGENEFNMYDLIGECDSYTFINRQFIQEAWSKLELKEQRCIYLYYYEQMRQNEIATQLGSSQMHVSRLIRKGLKKIQDYYNQVG